MVGVSVKNIGCCTVGRFRDTEGSQGPLAIKEPVNAMTPPNINGPMGIQGPVSDG